MTPKQWLSFWFVTLTWGTTFLWHKVALRELDPLTILLFRMVLGALVLAVVAAAVRPRWRGLGWAWLSPIALGLGNLALPHFLIVWGQQHVDSTVTSILIATTPLLTLLVAQPFLADERITLRRLAGMSTGFAGVVVLLSRNLDGGGEALPAQLGLIGAALCFAVTSVVARRWGAGIDPIVQAFAALVVASGAVGIAMAVAGQPLLWPRLGLSWAALLALGLVINGAALVQFYSLLTHVGPTKTQMISYVVPLFAVALGVAVLGEELHWQLAVGGLLILAAVAVFNRAPVRRPSPKPAGAEGSGSG